MNLRLDFGGTSFIKSSSRAVQLNCEWSILPNKRIGETKGCSKQKDAQQWEGSVSERVKGFKRCATDKLIIAKIKMGSNSKITCNRVTVLALCTISDGHLNVQVSFDYLLYFQRYAPDKFNIAKISKGNNSINTADRVMVLAICTSPHSLL